MTESRAIITENFVAESPAVTTEKKTELAVTSTEKKTELILPSVDLAKEIEDLFNEAKGDFQLLKDKVFGTDPTVRAQKISKNLIEYVCKLSPANKKHIKETLQEGMATYLYNERYYFFCYERMDEDTNRLIRTILKDTIFPPVFTTSIPQEELYKHVTLSIFEKELVFPKTTHILVMDVYDFNNLILKHTMLLEVQPIIDVPVSTESKEVLASGVTSRSIAPPECFSQIENVLGHVTSFYRSFPFTASVSRRNNEFTNTIATALGEHADAILNGEICEKAILNFACQLAPEYKATLGAIPVDGYATHNLVGAHVFLVYHKMNETLSLLFANVFKTKLPFIQVDYLNSKRKVKAFLLKNDINLADSDTPIGAFVIPLPDFAQLLRFMAINRVNSLVSTAEEKSISSKALIMPRMILYPNNIPVCDYKKEEVDREIAAYKKDPGSIPLGQIIANVLGLPVDEVEFTEKFEQTLFNLMRSYCEKIPNIVVDRRANTMFKPRHFRADKSDNGALILVRYENLPFFATEYMRVVLERMHIKTYSIMEKNFFAFLEGKDLPEFHFRAAVTSSEPGSILIWEVEEFCKVLQRLAAKRFGLDHLTLFAPAKVAISSEIKTEIKVDVTPARLTS